MIIENEVTFNRFDHKDTTFSLLIKSTITFTTIVLVGLVFYYHRIDLSLYCVDNSIDDWRIALTRTKILSIIFEAFVSTTTTTTTQMTTSTINTNDEPQAFVPIDVMLSLPRLEPVKNIPTVPIRPVSIPCSTGEIPAKNGVTFLSNYSEMTPSADARKQDVKFIKVKTEPEPTIPAPEMIITNGKHEFLLLFKPAEVDFEYKLNVSTLEKLEYLSYRVKLNFGECKWADALVDIAEIEILSKLNDRLRMIKAEVTVQTNLQQTRETISKAIAIGVEKKKKNKYDQLLKFIDETNIIDHSEKEENMPPLKRTRISSTTTNGSI
ncbi:unnamed protein product [Adineta ricciae]|uniref:Uncharacterized protein n=1 Tax=Adineta ricciae TaxID=249248 RepID=A0A815WT42_ADIRI|nr:unnamed protein product [Adineta ricciae]